jgi:hypothetical protein
MRAIPFTVTFLQRDQGLRPWTSGITLFTRLLHSPHWTLRVLTQRTQGQAEA